MYVLSPTTGSSTVALAQETNLVTFRSDGACSAVSLHLLRLVFLFWDVRRLLSLSRGNVLNPLPFGQPPTNCPSY